MHTYEKIIFSSLFFTTEQRIFSSFACTREGKIKLYYLNNLILKGKRGLLNPQKYQTAADSQKFALDKENCKLKVSRLNVSTAQLQDDKVR